MKICRILPYTVGTSKNNRQKENSKLKVVKYFFQFLKMAKNDLDIKYMKTNLFAPFSSVFAFTQAEEQI